LGCSKQELSSVLRVLGYRLAKPPRAAKTPAPPETADAAPTETISETAPEPPSDAGAAETPPAAEDPVELWRSPRPPRRRETAKQPHAPSSPFAALATLHAREAHAKPRRPARSRPRRASKRAPKRASE
jgi:hypothetical protein